jgi:hypothetical protein
LLACVWCSCCPAEFALLRLFAKEQAERGGPSYADGKPLVHAVYVAPLEALVAEKYAEWSEKLGKPLGIKIAKLTGMISKPSEGLGPHLLCVALQVVGCDCCLLAVSDSVQRCCLQRN